MIDPIGQVWTPFVSVRGDAASMSVTDEPAVQNFIAPGNTR